MLVFTYLQSAPDLWICSEFLSASICVYRRFPFAFQLPPLAPVRNSSAVFQSGMQCVN